jgi:hypothetical protein
MRTLLLTCLVTASPWCLAADQVRDLPEFTSIVSRGAFSLTVTAGQKQSVEVSADDNFLPSVVTRVQGKELRITLPEKSHLGTNDKVRITIRMPQLDRFSMEGVGSTTLHDMVGERLQIDYQGVGLLRADGKVQKLVVRAEGVGSIQAKDLKAQYVDADLQGVGSVTVRASDTLNAKLGGIGSLTYYGNPPNVLKTVGGLGSVRAGGD